MIKSQKPRAKSKYRKGKAKKMKSTKIQKPSKCGYVLVAKPGIYGCGV